MGGKTRKCVYYACAPKKAYLPAGHPAAGGVFVREDHLPEKVNAFLSDHVFANCSTPTSVTSTPPWRRSANSRSQDSGGRSPTSTSRSNGRSATSNSSTTTGDDPISILVVHLLHTYSNTPELLSDLESVAWTVRRADLQDEPVLPSTERAWRLQDRLTEAQMDAVVAGYYSGTLVAQLTRQYGINHWSVNKLVRERGHHFRQDGSDKATAVP